MPAARINTPIAAVAWKNLQQIRVYYIIVNGRVQEIVYFQGGGWQKGPTLGTAVENSTCLVGFQSSAALQTITEALYNVKEG
ncbi:hypothetical protein EDB19DRAFT_1911021 [Suillus lakei]|nr:hypothetical protein EDB19DRAFT_1911021 [Suillus lakei]